MCASNLPRIQHISGLSLSFFANLSASIDNLSLLLVQYSIFARTSMLSILSGSILKMRSNWVSALLNAIDRHVHSLDNPKNYEDDDYRLSHIKILPVAS